MREIVQYAVKNAKSHSMQPLNVIKPQKIKSYLK
jgi:hypothetical protein